MRRLNHSGRVIKGITRIVTLWRVRVRVRIMVRGWGHREGVDGEDTHHEEPYRLMGRVSVRCKVSSVYS